MLQRMTAAELADWRAFAKLEPLGEEREDFRVGLLCSVIVNSQRGGRGRVAKPNDFMPIQKARRKAMLDGDVDSQALEAFASAVKRSGRKLRGR